MLAVRCLASPTAFVSPAGHRFLCVLVLRSAVNGRLRGAAWQSTTDPISMGCDDKLRSLPNVITPSFLARREAGDMKVSRLWAEPLAEGYVGGVDQLPEGSTKGVRLGF